MNDDSTAVLDEVEFTAVNPGGTTLDSLEIVAESATSGGGVTGAPAPAPRTLALAVSPNPFDAATALRFVLPTAERLRLGVYDLAGRLVRSLHDGAMAEGEHRTAWAGADAAGRAVRAGVYFVRLGAGPRSLQSKVVRMR